MKKIIYLVVLLFCNKNIYCQNTIENLDMFLSHKFLISANDLYVYIEISIWNRNAESIFVLKNYDIVDVIEEEDGIILILSSWIDRLDYLKYTSAMYHDPQMIEFRNMQSVYLPLLLKIPENNVNFDQNKIIKEIKGLKYSFSQYITEDISWASNVDEFADGIRGKVSELIFVYNKYDHKYGNLWISPLSPPEWIIGTWIVDRFFNEERVSPNDRIIFERNDVLYFWNNLNELYFEYGFNKIEQNIFDNDYEIIFQADDGAIFSINFKLENGYLFSEQLRNDGTLNYKLRKKK